MKVHEILEHQVDLSFSEVTSLAVVLFLYLVQAK